MTRFVEVRRQLHEVGEDPDDPERRRDRHDRECEREEERERAEGEDEDEKSDRNRDQLASGEVVGQHRVEVVLDRRLAGDVDLRSRRARPRPRASRRCAPSSRRARDSRRSARRRRRRRPPRPRRDGRSAAPRRLSRRPPAPADTSAVAGPSVLATTVNVPVERCRKWSSRIRSARRVSVPGSVKRLVRSPESCVEARPQRPNTTIQAPSTSQRCRRTRRVSPSIGLDARALSPCPPLRASRFLSPPNAGYSTHGGDPHVDNGSEKPRNEG